MNVELLNKVRKHILQRPTRLRMSTWIVDPERISDHFDTASTVTIQKRKGKKVFNFHLVSSWNEPQEQPIPECNTVGCIAGWACILAGFQTLESLKGWGPSSKAQSLLGLSADQAIKLFHVTDWPEPFKSQYLDGPVKTAKQRAKIAAARIDFFIKTKGTDRKEISSPVNS